jgi:zinc transport system ATP-binding protein
MLIVTHELEALADIVTRIVAMSAGRVVFDGPPAAFAREQARLGALGHGHHHPDELEPGASRLAGAPAAGPLDPRGDRRRG